jgi:GDP-4-dehydro-6-deoxy-D-mannose reductase
MKVLITGITGMVGSWLAEHYLDLGWEVHGTIRYRSIRENIDHIDDRIHLHMCELRDFSNVLDVMWEVMPHRIHHMAASSFVRTSWAEPWEVMVNNVKPQINIFESILRINGFKRFDDDRPLEYNPRVHTALSSEQMGNPSDEWIPMTEKNPMYAESPYAASKITADSMGYCYYKSYGINSIQLLSFNMTGPRRGRDFVCSSFACQIASIEKGLIEPVIKTGNLDSIRDFTDVRDAVKGMQLACEKCNPGEKYILAAGNHVSIRQVLDRLLDLSICKDIRVEVRKENLRPSDVKELRGDASHFMERTGWKPQYDFFMDTLPDILEYWRHKIGNRSGT